MTKPKNQDRKIAVVGGDLREIAAADALREAGYPVALYGYEAYGEIESRPISSGLERADVLILPIPVLRSGNLNLPFSEERIAAGDLIPTLVKHVKPRLVFGGLIPDDLTKALSDRSIAVCDVCREERFQVLNSVPTAEGAIAIAMVHLPVTLHDAKTAVLGYGRIGKTLCRDLLGLGSDVTAVSRRDRDLAESALVGCRACDYETLPSLADDFDVIFNTVPHTVVTDPILHRLKSKAFIVDLASKPGGVDSDAALRYGIRVIRALSLPGKVAPVSAGRILADSILRRLSDGAPSREGVPT